MMGAKLVMPGARLDGASVHEMLSTEKVTCTAGVPTVWLMLLQYMQKEGKTLPDLKRLVVGGSAAPRAMIEAFEKQYGIEVLHAWGMTEMSPLGSLGSIKASGAHLQGEALYDLKVKQGYAPFTVEMKITDDEGKELPWDGKTFGRLKVAGPAVASAYFRVDENILDENGFFDTGDVATIDSNGYMQITDRSKDVIKSAASGYLQLILKILQSVIPTLRKQLSSALPIPNGTSARFSSSCRRKAAHQTREGLLEFMQGKIAKWWMPDDVQFVPEIPHTATGKINKVTLRQQFKDYRLPG